MNLRIDYFSDSAYVEMATAYGTLKTRVLTLHFDIRGNDGNLPIGDIHTELLKQWGFDLADLVDCRIEPEIRRLTFSQKWWDRSERKSES